MRGVWARWGVDLRDHEERDRRLVADEGDRVHQRVCLTRVECEDELKDPVSMAWAKAQTPESGVRESSLGV